MLIGQFNYLNPLFLIKDLISTKQDKYLRIVNAIYNELIDLRNNINRKEIPENEFLKKSSQHF